MQTSLLPLLPIASYNNVFVARNHTLSIILFCLISCHGYVVILGLIKAHFYDKAWVGGCLWTCKVAVIEPVRFGDLVAVHLQQWYGLIYCI